MNKCDNKRLAECYSNPESCKFHKKCNNCNGFHFVDRDPKVQYVGGGSQQAPYDWPPKYPHNIACAGRDYEYVVRPT